MIRVGDSVLVREADIVGRVVEVLSGRRFVVVPTSAYAPGGPRVVPAARLERL